MIFTITYRDAGGAMREEAVEAANRAEALAAMKARGIAPMMIREASAPRLRTAAEAARREPNRRGAKAAFPYFHNSTFSHFHIFTIAAVAVVAAIAAWWWLGRDKAQPSPTPPPKKTKPLKPSTPQIPKPSSLQAKALPLQQPPATNAAGIPINADGKPLWLYPPPPMDRPAITAGTHHVMTLEERVFPHASDQMVASLLMLEPGETVVGESEHMFHGFAKEFRKSLETPIVVEEGDSDLVRALKEGVREMRNELKARLDAGEDIEKTLEDSRRELRELSLYRDELEAKLRELGEDSEMTASDLADYLKAANQMLSERGAKEIEMPTMLFRRLRLREAKRNAAKR